MKSRKSITLGLMLAALAIMPSVIYAQSGPETENQENTQANDDYQDFYSNELFHCTFNTLFGLRLNFQNEISGTTLGIKEPMKFALMQYEDTSRQYRTYKNKVVVGNVVLGTALAAVNIGGAVPLFFGDKLNDTQKNAFTGVVAGGIVTLLVSQIILQSAQKDLFEAVNLYNSRKTDDWYHNRTN